MNNNDKFHGTTIVGVRRGKEVVVGGDGQVTLGNTVMKNNAKKVRRLYKDNVIAGFAGATADAFAPIEKKMVWKNSFWPFGVPKKKEVAIENPKGLNPGFSKSADPVKRFSGPP